MTTQNKDAEGPEHDLVEKLKRAELNPDGHLSKDLLSGITAYLTKCIEKNAKPIVLLKEVSDPIRIEFYRTATAYLKEKGEKNYKTWITLYESLLKQYERLEGVRKC
jgi:hypothetical protein